MKYRNFDMIIQLSLLLKVEHLNYAAVRVDRRLANPPSKPNIWTEVLKRGGKDGNLTLGEMHANSSIFMLAGTETTATLLRSGPPSLSRAFRLF